jgi:hypothetical protein
MSAIMLDDKQAHNETGRGDQEERRHPSIPGSQTPIHAARAHNEHDETAGELPQTCLYVWLSIGYNEFNPFWFLLLPSILSNSGQFLSPFILLILSQNRTG